MSRRIRIDRPADLDINRAIIWYEEKRPGLGREFAAELRRTVREIAKRPNSFPFDYLTARRARLDRFPYKVYFVVVDENVIKIIGVLHDSQTTDRLHGRF